MTTPNSSGSGTASGPVLRLSAASGSFAARTEPGGVRSIASPESLSPTHISAPSAPETTSGAPNMSLPKSATTRPAEFVQTFAGASTRTMRAAVSCAAAAGAAAAGVHTAQIAAAAMHPLITSCVFMPI